MILHSLIKGLLVLFWHLDCSLLIKLDIAPKSPEEAILLKTFFKTISLLMGLLLTWSASPKAHAANTIYVDPATGADNNNCGPVATPCKSIKQAAAMAQNGDMIQIPAGTFNESIFLPAPGKTLIFSGEGTGNTATNKTTIAPSSGRAFIVGQNANWTLGNLTIKGEGIQNAGELTLNHCLVTGINSNVDGGGLMNQGKLYLNESTVHDNSSSENGGGVYNDGASAATWVTHSTISKNKASAQGGGIYNDEGTVTITDSTISGNQADGPSSYGGGIYSKNGSIVIYNGSIVENSATIAGGGVNKWGSAKFFVSNTLIAKNSASSTNLKNCNDKLGSTNYYNLEDANGCGFDPSKGDQINTDPLIGELSYNGGWNLTHPLLAKSPAVDKGTNPQSPTDQRDKPRIGAHADIGSYERGICGDAFKESDEECDGGSDCDTSCKKIAAVANGGPNSGNPDPGSAGKSGQGIGGVGNNTHSTGNGTEQENIGNGASSGQNWSCSLRH